MTDTLETVLRLVEDGGLTPEEASQIIAALETRAHSSEPRQDQPASADPRASRPRSLRVEVTEGGRSVVNLRLPASIGELALLRIPGLSSDDSSRIREALRVGLAGDLVRAVDAQGNGVRITVE